MDKIARFRKNVAARLLPRLLPLVRARETALTYLARVRLFRHQQAHWLFLLALVPVFEQFFELGPALWSRLTYQLEIGWDEGGGLLHASRIMHGEPLYTPPNVGFMPFPYPPGHPLVIAGLARIFGLDFTIGRAVSLISILGCAGLLAREVSKSWSGTRWPWIWGALSFGLIAAGFPIAGGYYDLIRVDSLALFFAVAGCVAVLAYEQDPRPWRLAVCVFLLTAAVFTKQTGAAYVAWILLFAFLGRPARGLLLGATFLAAAGGSIALLQWRTDGHFLYYVYFALKKHHVTKERLELGFNVIQNFAPYMMLIPVAAFLAAWKNQLSRRALAWLGMFIAALPVCLVPYAKQGGHTNNFIGLVVLVGPVALCLAGSILSQHAKRKRPVAVEALVLAAAVAFYTHDRIFDAKQYTVTKAQRAGSVELFKWIASFGRRTLVPMYPYHALAVGTDLEQTHSMPWIDASWAGGDSGAFARYVRRLKVDHMIITGLDLSFILDLAAKEFTLESVRPEGSPMYVGESVLLPQFALKPRRKRVTPRCLFDFERGNFEGWTGDVATFRAPQRRDGSDYIGAEGRYFLNTFSNGGDGLTGMLLSPTFTIDKPNLSLLVGGGSSGGERVELIVGGSVVRTARGMRADLLADVVWDVREFKGNTAQIRVVDQERGTWGHVNVDSVCLED